MPKQNNPTKIMRVDAYKIPLDSDGRINAPINYADSDAIWVFYSPQGKLVKCATFDEAYAKWLLTRGE